MNAPETAVARFTLTAPVTITPPPLADGERWAGVVTTEKGLHHIILLPGDQDGATWKKQMAWAKKAGGDLPDRVELATLRRTLPDEFKPEAYWSNEPHAADSDYAWYQYFDYGYQDSSYVTSELRARSVRRVATSPSSIHQFRGTIMLAPPLVITVIEATQNRMAAAFTEWERRYREEPERFMSEAAKLLKETPESYGEACAPYFLSILQEQAGVQPAPTVHTSAPANLPAIGDAYAGGIYAGLTLLDNRVKALVLLPGDEELKWKDAITWAENQGGVLPSRIDQLVLWKNVKDQFKGEWYRSGEQYAPDTGYAWCQNFGFGGQNVTRKDVTGRARAVRRLTIQ